MTRYRGDPYWLKARFAGECAGCGAAIERGQEAFYYPNGKSLYGRACGCGPERSAEFDAAAADEDMMGGGA